METPQPRPPKTPKKTMALCRLRENFCLSENFVLVKILGLPKPLRKLRRSADLEKIFVLVKILS